MMTNFRTLPDLALVEHLAFNMTKLPEKDREFAASMASSVASRRGATEKQRYWLERLCDLTEGREPQKKQVQDVGDLSGVIALFDNAARHLKFPAVVLGSGEQTLRLTVAGPTSKAPGSINVTSPGPFDTRTWYGRIDRNGKMSLSSKAALPDGALDQLRRFAANPADVAAQHGRQTGACCFCARELTDARSVAVGYGPICADHYGLPWGE